MWMLVLLGCDGNEFFNAPDLAAFDATSVQVTGDWRQDSMDSVMFTVVSGAAEDCRYPIEATFEVNGVAPTRIDEEGPGGGCPGSQFKYLDGDAAALADGGPDAELRLADEDTELVVVVTGLVAGHSVVPDSTTVPTGGTLTVDWVSPLPFGEYMFLDLMIGDDSVADVAPPDEEEPEDGHWSFPVDLPAAAVVLDYFVLAGISDCTGDVPCDESQSVLHVTGGVDIDIVD